MTPDDELRRLALGALPQTKGRWKYRRCDFGNGPDPLYSYVEWGKPDDGYGTGALSVPLARYIAAASPDRITALLDRLRVPLDIDECPDCGSFLRSGDGHNDGCRWTGTGSSLDAAWAVAEAALPAGWRLWSLLGGTDEWQAVAGSETADTPDPFICIRSAPTPAAALLALAQALSEPPTARDVDAAWDALHETLSYSPDWPVSQGQDADGDD